ncbi:MAG TPA: bifunctional 5,10-methylenetetrahydrofolate dehydrogenase/5,10-methenyltetrahydrofolate cyclohydrolase [Usitatibacter sp.]|nr:bifunctional 5,10-methylenetetrahydrofolate dehydrogenase/5,10-methenyltetrahydrofolate cyclohydrolase [Usitatibacter sp.]
MSAVRIDGAACARELLAETAERGAALAARGIRPALAVLVVGDQVASQIYVRNKERACAACGIASRRVSLPAEAPRETVLAALAQLNADPAVHGILVQLPLPAHLDVREVIAAIAAAKDVDGFRADHLGALLVGAPGFAPCTPSAVLRLLDAYSIPVAGRHAVVVGRSNIVGKPLALMLMERGATVTVCNSRTAVLERFTREADVLVVAAGRPGLVTGSMVKPDAAVIDVGIHRSADGRITGDVDFESVDRVARHLTPVPGGVGPMTVACLVANAVSAAEASACAPLAAHSVYRAH